MPELLCDFSAGYAVAGVAGGIGFVIVGFGVDDDRGAAVAEQRVCAIAEGYVVVLELQIGYAVCFRKACATLAQHRPGDPSKYWLNYANPVRVNLNP